MPLSFICLWMLVVIVAIVIISNKVVDGDSVSHGNFNHLVAFATREVVAAMNVVVAFAVIIAFALTESYRVSIFKVGRNPSQYDNTLHKIPQW